MNEDLKEDTILNQLRTVEQLTADIMDRLATDVLPPLDVSVEDRLRPEVAYLEGSIPQRLDRVIGRLEHLEGMVRTASVRIGARQLREEESQQKAR